MSVLQPSPGVGQLIAPLSTSAKPAILGSCYGLDASRIPYTCLRNPDGPDSRPLHLLDEPHGRGSYLAGSSDRQTKRRHPHARDEIRRLKQPSFPLSTPRSRLLLSFS